MKIKKFLKKLALKIFLFRYTASSFLIHLLFLSVLLFAGSKSQKDTKDKSEILNILDFVKVVDSNNIRLKDTDANSDHKKQKQFATSESLTKQSEQEKEISSIELLKKDDQKSEGSAPILIKKPKAKPQGKSRKPSKMKTSPLKEDDDLASLLQSLEEDKTGGSVQSTGQESGIIGKGEATFDKLKPMGIDSINSIRSQFIKCWNVPISIMDMQDLFVAIEIELDQKGNVLNALVKENKFYKDKSKQAFVSALADSALRAVYSCNPLKNLPEESFTSWNKIQLTFSIDDMM